MERELGLEDVAGQMSTMQNNFYWHSGENYKSKNKACFLQIFMMGLFQSLGGIFVAAVLTLMELESGPQDVHTNN